MGEATRVLNIGSVNLDKVYHLDAFVEAGQTVFAHAFETFSGGKGLNQSVALARAGASVFHAGAIGADGAPLRQTLAAAGADTHLLREVDVPTGQAIIQVDAGGDNCIFLFRGANSAITTQMIDEALAEFAAGDYLVLQNEVSNVGHAITQAAAKGMTVVLTPAPVTPELLADYPLDKVGCWMLNEGEARMVCGADKTLSGEGLLAAMRRKFPQASVVLTLGGKGALYGGSEGMFRHPIYAVPVVDTTAAGDTFCGYFVACRAKGMDVPAALEAASKAAAIAVSRAGAAPSIPTWEAVQAFSAKACV